MRRYESVVILDPDLPDDEIVGFTERFGNVIKNNGGEIIKIEDWGSKRLAYLVHKKDKGRYILFDFVGLPAVMREVERQFKITEEVMKFLSVKLDEEVDLEAFKANAAQQEAAAAEAEAAKVAAAAEAEAAKAAAAAPVAEEGAPAQEPGEAAAPEPPASQPEPPVSSESASETPEAEPAQEAAEPPAPEEQASSPDKQNEEV